MMEESGSGLNMTWWLAMVGGDNDVERVRGDWRENLRLCIDIVHENAVMEGQIG